MSELCLNLLTKIVVPAGSAPLEQIWSVDHWLSSLPRVISMDCQADTADYQRFDLVFDADRPSPDRITVERRRYPDAIDVVHLSPPPGVNSLRATWWTDSSQRDVLFAKRCILLDESEYSPALARKMFSLLRENLELLIGDLS